MFSKYVFSFQRRFKKNHLNSRHVFSFTKFHRQTFRIFLICGVDGEKNWKLDEVTTTLTGCKTVNFVLNVLNPCVISMSASFVSNKINIHQNLPSEILSISHFPNHPADANISLTRPPKSIINTQNTFVYILNLVYAEVPRFSILPML